MVAIAICTAAATANSEKPQAAGRFSRHAAPVNAAPPVFDACFDYHGQRFALSGDLLRGIARVESGMRPHAINDSHMARTHTRDIGLMQINSSLLPKLAPFGIGERELLDPCTSIEVGAWVLADTLRRHGHSWQGVGAYNAACTQLRGQACTDARSRYAWAVYRRMGVTPSAQPAIAIWAPAPRNLGGLVQITLAGDDAGNIAGVAP